MPELHADTAVATAGYYRMHWSPPAVDQNLRLQYELQESRDAAFTAAETRYRGPDLATVLSGRDDGVRHYRVRVLRDGSDPGEWSAPVSVETRHHPLARALGFFAFGALVFVLTLALVLRGAREPAEENSPARG